MATMKEAQVQRDISVTFHDVPLPQITDPSHIIVKVVVSGGNPKDWKMPAGILKTIGDCPNSGDDIAGIVHAVGSAVTEFRPGDRVAALHQLGAPHGSYAEYALVNDFATFHLGESVSFEEGASVPMNAFMASIGLFAMLKIASGPWTQLDEKTPLLIYGASSGTGAMALKLAKIVNIHPLICVAGRGKEFVEEMLDKDKGDVVLDYRQSDEEFVRQVTAALQGEKLIYAFDAISEYGSYLRIAQCLDHSQGKLTIVLPRHIDEIPQSIEQSTTMAGSLWEVVHSRAGNDIGKMDFGPGGRDFAFVFSRLIGRFLQDGRLKGLSHKIVDGGLDGLSDALKNIRDNKAVTGTKYVFRIADTASFRR